MAPTKVTSSLPHGTFSMRELISTKFPPQSYWIDEGLLRYGAKLVIGGAPKSHKSFVLNSIIADMVIGGSLFETYANLHGRQERRFHCPGGARVLLLEQEIGDEGLQERFKDFIAAQDTAQQTLLLDHVFINSCNKELRLDEPTGVRYIEEVIDATKPDIVAFDPLVEFHSVDENSTQEVMKMLSAIDRMRAKFNFATIINHHAKKPQTGGFGGGSTGPNALRGSSSLYGKVDGVLMLSLANENAGIVTIAPTLRRARPIWPFQVKLDKNLLKHRFHKWVKRGKHDEDEE
jgi:hypothetical protein